MASHTSSAEASAFQLLPDLYHSSGTRHSWQTFHLLLVSSRTPNRGAYDLALTPLRLVPLFDHKGFHTQRLGRPKHSHLFFHCQRPGHSSPTPYSMLSAFVRRSVAAPSACVAAVTTAGGSAAALVYVRHDLHANRIRQFGGPGARLGSRAGRWLVVIGRGASQPPL